MTIERTPIHLMDISYKFNLSERTINRDLEDLHKIFPSILISIVKDGYGQDRRSASASRSLKTNQRHESLKFQELSTRIKTIIEMADILASSKNVEVADTCSKYKLSERTLRRYMKLIKDVFLNMNVKFSKDKGYYSIN
jgi:transcriptional antiterminator